MFAVGCTWRLMDCKRAVRSRCQALYTTCSSTIKYRMQSYALTTCSTSTMLTYRSSTVLYSLILLLPFPSLVLYSCSPSLDLDLPLFLNVSLSVTVTATSTLSFTLSLFGFEIRTLSCNSLSLSSHPPTSLSAARLGNMAAQRGHPVARGVGRFCDQRKYPLPQPTTIRHISMGWWEGQQRRGYPFPG